MAVSDTKTKIVRPFGLLGGPYEVGMAGVWKNRLAWLTAVTVIGLSIFREQLAAPERLTNWALGVGTVICLALSVDVVRKGRRV